MTTTKPKHTTSGWTVMNHRDLAAGDRYEGAYEILEAVSGEHEWNQKLIAAAPDLLAAIKNLRKGGWHNPDCPSNEGDDCDCEMAARYAAADAAITKAGGAS